MNFEIASPPIAQREVGFDYNELFELLESVNGEAHVRVCTSNGYREINRLRAAVSYRYGPKGRSRQYESQVGSDSHVYIRLEPR